MCYAMNTLKESVSLKNIKKRTHYMNIYRESNVSPKITFKLTDGDDKW